MIDKLVIDGRTVAAFSVDDEVGHLVRDFDVSFTAKTEAELRTLSVMLGGIDRYGVGGSGKVLSSPSDLVTEDGRDVDVWIWLEGELEPKRPDPVPPASAVEAVRAAAREHREMVRERVTVDG